MPPKTWKVVERRIARYLGTERTPLSGGNGRQTRSDTLHPRLYVEAKFGSACPRSWRAIAKLCCDTQLKAHPEHKFPVVILARKGSRTEDYDCYFFQYGLRVPGLGAGRWVGSTLTCVPLSTLRVLLDSSPPSIDARPGAEVQQATAGEPGGGPILQSGSPAPATEDVN